VQTVLYVVEIAVALGLIIFVHELGHFLACKWFGVWVRKFAIGFGPPLITWTRGDTEYSLRAFPLGGFVEPMGDHPESEGGGDPRALWRRPAWQRIVVFAGGVFMNAVLAVLFFTAAFMIGVSAMSPVVGGVVPLMPAQKAGILPGDRITAINEAPVESFEDI
jgi:regulator of sigma E protease